MGQVGQGVARLAADTSWTQDHGLRFRVTAALVRDVDRQRRCPTPARVTASPAAFLRGSYDVVIEALGAIEPAYGIVRQLLGRGIPVVTANKALVAARGQELKALAGRCGTTLRYEATALAGVPFLGALSARPLVSGVQHFAAIVNGTSNFILSRLEAGGSSFALALQEAQALGLTEPDPSRDLDGLDAADKLSLLASVFGWGSLAIASVDVQGIADITAQDLAIARSLDATIKPLVWATRSGDGVRAFIGPTLVPSRHPLGALDGTLSGIQLSGRYVSDLFFSGPGAGPDITAATLMDDAVEALTNVPRRLTTSKPVPPAPSTSSPDTHWLVRAEFRGVLPNPSTAAQIFRAQDLDVLGVPVAHGDALWLRVGTTSRGRIERATAGLSHTHRVQCHAIRSLVP